MMKKIKIDFLTAATFVFTGVCITAFISCRPSSKQKAETEKTIKADTMQTVTSKDGTKIAYDKTGKGPAIILVNGALAIRTDYNEIAQLLSPHFTAYSYDRRGRGNSGDNQQYEVEREIEDIEALIKEAGGSAYIFGISSGACLAVEAAAKLGDQVKKLVIYEAPYDDAKGSSEKWKEYKSTFKDLIAKHQHGEAVEYHLKFVGVPGEMITKMKESPAWPNFEKIAPSIAYDMAAVGNDRAVPVERAAKIKASTLVMDGGASKEAMPFMSQTADKLAKAIPNAQRKTLEGQAHNVDSKVVAPILIEFFGKN